MSVRSTIGSAVGTGWAVALAAVAAAPAGADVVELRSGGRLEGVVVQQTEQAVTVEASPGRLTLPRSQVVRVVPGRSALQVWRERAAVLSPRDVQGWVALARWAEDQGLGTQARESWERVLSASPGNVEANEALHHMQVNGRWVSEEEGYRARGFVHFQGQWMSRAEQEARVREQAAADAEQHQRREESLRMREAEAHVREAEARARAAETMGDGYGYGGGIYGSGIYGSGGYGGYTGTSLSPYYGNPNDAFYADAFYGNYPWGSYLNYDVRPLRGRPGLGRPGFGFGRGFAPPFFLRSVPPSSINAPLAPARPLSPRQRGTLVTGPTTPAAPAAQAGMGARGRH